MSEARSCLRWKRGSVSDWTYYWASGLLIFDRTSKGGRLK